MTDRDRATPEQRVLILAPTGKDAALTRSVLDQASVACLICPDLDRACVELDAGAGAILMTEETVSPSGRDCLTDWLARQPPWSDLPVLIVARHGADSTAVAQAMDRLGNVTVLERPIRVAALVSAARSALRGRRRQYQTREHLAERDRTAGELRTLLDTLPVGVFFAHDAACRRITGNRTGNELLRMGEGANLSKTAPDGERPTHFRPCRDGVEIPPAELPVQRAARGETIRDEEVDQVFADGSVVHTLVSASPLFDAAGRPRGAVASITDITARKRTEVQLAQHQKMLFDLVDRSPFGLYIVDADFRISHINADTQERAFRNVRPAVGRDFAEAIRVLWPEPVATEIIGIFRRTLATGEPYFSKDYVQARADIDEVESYEWELHRIALPDGQFGVVCYYYDSTRLRKAEQALKDADRRKDEFLATLAHELRNPLAPIRNSLHILRMSTAADPAVERVGEMIERQVNHMVRLVDDLMEVSRITRGKIELRKEPVAVAAVVRSAVETSRPLIDAAGHQLALSIPADPLTVDGDPVRLAQVFANLLNNAAKYTEPGGQIRLSVTREGDAVAVAVRDNGLGIAAEMLPRVFDMFTQVNRSDARSQGGLGIGLTLVKSLAEMHGGTVRVHSDGAGAGSEFVVRLPLAGGAARVGGANPGAAPAGALARRRILVVDDNRDAAESLGMLLGLLGAEVRVVFSGPDALAAIGEFRPSAVLLDIGMPGMDGREVARQLRERPEYRDITLIALTGWGQDEDRRQSELAGFNHHLTKPADIGTLEVLLRPR